MPSVFSPKITEAGLALAGAGIVTITDVAFGTGIYTPVGDETALDTEVARVAASGSNITPTQVRILAVWDDDVGLVNVSEVGFYAGATLFAVWSSEVEGETPVAVKTDGAPFAFFYDLGVSALPPESVTVLADTGQSQMLAALNEHINEQEAHPQYQREDGLANNSDGIWCGTAGGTANAITLTLPALPVTQVYPAYKAGTRFTFKASADNSSTVTVNIGGLGAKAITKDGSVPLISSDIKSGGIYEIVYDGTQFQISGSVGGSGQVLDVQEFSGAGPYTLDYTIGRVSAYLNGRLLGSADFTATDGTTIDIPSATAGDEVVFICYSTFAVADTYTIAQTDAIVGHAHGALLTYVGATEVKVVRENGNRQYINGKNELIPAAGVSLLNPSGLSPDTVYYVYVYMTGGAMAAEASTVGYVTSVSTGEKVKFGDTTRALVGMLKTNGSGYFSSQMLRSWHNDSGVYATGSFTANRSVSDSVASAAWVELSSEIRADFLVWADDIVSVSINGGALIDLGSSDDAYGIVALAFDGVVAEDGASVIGATTAGGLSSVDWSPIAVNRRRTGLSEGSHYATVVGTIAVTAGTGIDLVCLGSGTVGKRTFLQVTTLPKYR